MTKANRPIMVTIKYNPTTWYKITMSYKRLNNALRYHQNAFVGATSIEAKWLDNWLADNMPIEDGKLYKIPAATVRPYDEVGNIIAYEQGELSEGDMLVLFSHLVANGHAWQLQGSYGRQAAAFINGGYLSQTGEILKDLDND